MKIKEQPQSPFPENSVLKKYQCPNCHLMVWHEKSEDCKKEQPQEQWIKTSENKTQGLEFYRDERAFISVPIAVPSSLVSQIESRARADLLKELESIMEKSYEDGHLVWEFIEKYKCGGKVRG